MKRISWIFLVVIFMASSALALDRCPNNKEVNILMCEVNKCRELLYWDDTLSTIEKMELQKLIERATKRAHELCQKDREDRNRLLRTELLGEK